MSENYQPIEIKEDNVKSIFTCWTEALRRFLDANGRTTRYEFWAFQTVSLFILLLASLIGYAFSAYTIVFEVFALYFLAPATTVGVRRLHDMGVSGWNMLAFVILGVFLILNMETGIGNFIILAFLSLSYVSYLYLILSAKGEQADNKYGIRVYEPEIYDQDSRCFIIFMFSFLLCLWGAFFVNLF